MAIIRPPSLKGKLDPQAENYIVEMHGALLSLDAMRRQLESNLATTNQKVQQKAGTYSATGPPATAKSWTVAHGLGTTHVIVQVRNQSTGAIVSTPVEVVDADTVRLTSAVDMTANQFTVVVHG